jgi:hypothetical protein
MLQTTPAIPAMAYALSSPQRRAADLPSKKSIMA